MPRKPKGQRKEYDRPGLEDDDLDLDQDEEEIDPEVKEIFEEAQELDFGRRDLLRKLQTHTDRTPELTGGDLDAAWEYADIGEEAVGGQNPTPDQSVVDEEGEALGVTYNDNEPLHTTDKLQERDRNPWELNPASSPDFSARVKEEFNAPLQALVTGMPATSQTETGKGKRARGKQGKTVPKPEQSKTANRSAKEDAARNSKAKGPHRTDASRSTATKRATNVARGVRGAPAHVRGKTIKGKRNTSTHTK